MVVRDKRGDIAILQSFGASSRSITAVFATQGTIIGVIGTVFGVLLGMAVASQLGNAVYFVESVLGIELLSGEVYFISDLPTDIRAGEVVRIALLGIVLAVSATLYPAISASVNHQWRRLDMNEPVLVVEGLVKHFSEADRTLEVLKGVDLRVHPGDRLAIVGASGSGKSTLLQLLGGLDEATAGEVTICGEAMMRLSNNRKGALRNRALGFVYQFHHLLPEFSALENVAMPLLVRGNAPREAAARAEDLLTRVGLAERLSHRPGKLSGGERQRVAVARALVTRPRWSWRTNPPATWTVPPVRASSISCWNSTRTWARAWLSLPMIRIWLHSWIGYWSCGTECCTL